MNALERQRSRRLATGLCIVMIAQAAHVPLAVAQQPKGTIAEELPTDELREEWKRALDLVDNKDWAKALERFRRIYDQTKNPRVLYNVGVCEKQLKHYARALAAWEQALATNAGRLSAVEEQNIKSALVALRPFVTTLSITSNEADATVVINGIESGTTPLAAPIPVDVARLVVTLKKPGFHDKTVEIETETGKAASLDFQLEPAAKSALVTVDVSGAAGAVVYVDGVDMGPAPFKGKLAPGRHTIEARAPSHETAKKTVDVVAGVPLNLALAVSKTRNDGKVRIVVPGHPDALIEIDGKSVGRGAYSGVLPVGGHQLVVRKSGYLLVQNDLAIARDQVRSMDIKLVRDRGTSYAFGLVGGIIIVVGAAAVTSIFLVKGADGTPVSGTLNGGITPAGFRFR